MIEPEVTDYKPGETYLHFFSHKVDVQVFRAFVSYLKSHPKYTEPLTFNLGNCYDDPVLERRIYAPVLASELGVEVVVGALDWSTGGYDVRDPNVVTNYFPDPLICDHHSKFVPTRDTFSSLNHL
jgi:hypothetical protein